MSANLPANQSPPNAVQLPAPRSRRRLYLLTAATLLAGAGATAAVWWYNRGTDAPPEVPLPADVQDADVRRVVEAARERVVAKLDSAEEWGFYGMTLAANLFDKEADFCFERAGRLAPDDARWLFLRGLIALKRDPDHALPLLRRAAEAQEATPELHTLIRLRLAEALLERRENAGAEEIFREEWERRPGDPRAALGLGMLFALRDKEQDRKAAEEFLKIARASPSARKTATIQLAALAGARGERAAAATYAREADALPPDQFWPDPLREQIESLQAGRRGREREIAALERERRFAEAAQLHLRQIDTAGPTVADCLGAGLNLVRAREYERGLDLLRQAVELDPASSKTHVTLALAQLGRAERELAAGAGRERVRVWLEEAVTHAQEAARLRPDLARAYMAWGLGLKHLGRPAEAVPPLRQGVACLPADFELQLALGEALLEAHDPAGAREPLGNARQLEPNDPRLKAALERLAKAPE
jgi:Flp pilus assembly protein TadD